MSEELSMNKLGTMKINLEFSASAFTLPVRLRIRKSKIWWSLTSESAVSLRWNRIFFNF